VHRSDLSGDCTSAIIGMSDRSPRRLYGRLYANCKKKWLSVLFDDAATDTNAWAMDLC